MAVLANQGAGSWIKFPERLQSRKKAEKDNLGSLGFNEHRWLHKPWGNIGSTRPMRYTEVDLLCASLSVTVPSFRKWATSAMWTPTSIWFLFGRSTTWMASSKSLAVAGSMVKIRRLRRSFRLATSDRKFSFASLTIPSTSSNSSSGKSTSWSSNSLAINACFSSASRLPARPKHWPCNLAKGCLENSFHVMICMGHKMKGSSFPGSFSTFLVTWLICSSMVGKRLSVGIAFTKLSSACTWPSPFFCRSGCRVQTNTRPEPFFSAIATTLAIFTSSNWVPKFICYKKHEQTYIVTHACNRLRIHHWDHHPLFCIILFEGRKTSLATWTIIPFLPFLWLTL